MRRLALRADAAAVLIAIALLFVSCAGTLSPRKALYEARGHYIVLMDEAVLPYARMPSCTAERVLACSDPAVVKEMARLAREADLRLDEAEAQIRASSAAPGLSAARAAVAALAAYLVSKGMAE